MDPEVQQTFGASALNLKEGIMSTSGIGGIGGSGFNPQAMASKMADRIMKDADSDGSGTLNKAELTAFKAKMGGQGPDVDEVFASYNTSGDGELTQGELKSAFEAEGAKMAAQGGMPGGGSPLASVSGSSSNQRVSSDPKDLNQDGQVTSFEILLYSLKHSDQSLTSETARTIGSSGAPGSVDLKA